MKKCPKCGADNGPDSLECSSCKSPLGESEGSAGYRPSVAGPGAANSYRPSVAGPGLVDNVIRSGGPLASNEETDEPISVVGQPLGGYQGQQPNQYGGPQTDAYGTVTGPPRLRYRENPDMKPVRYSLIGTIIGPIITLMIVLAGGAFAYWKYVYLPQGPLAAMRVFVPYAVSSDVGGLQACLSQDSQYILQMAEKQRRLGRGNVSFDFFHGQSMGFNEGKEYVLKVESVDQKTAKVIVKPGPAPIDGFKEEDLPPAQKEGLRFTLVKEGQQWKVDLAQSMQDIYPNSSMAPGVPSTASMPGMR